MAVHSHTGSSRDAAQETYPQSLKEKLRHTYDVVDLYIHLVEPRTENQRRKTEKAITDTQEPNTEHRDRKRKPRTEPRIKNTPSKAP